MSAAATVAIYMAGVYQQSATQFEWKFTKSDLDLLLKRLAAHEPGPALAA